MSSGGSPPPAPDVVGAAAQQGQQQLANTVAAQQGSLVSQYTPYGSLVYSQGPNSPQGNPTYQSQTSLSPAGQNLLTGQQGAQQSLIPGAQSLAGQAASNYSQPMDLSSVGDVANKAYSNYTERLDPQWAHTDEMLDTQLKNQGLQPGTEAYDNAKRLESNAKNDAYTQASTAAIGTMPQTYNLANSIYNQPASSLQTVLGDINPTGPTFGNNPQQQVAQAAPLAQAAQAQGQYGLNAYNAQVGQQNSMNSGLFGLGSAGINSGLFNLGGSAAQGYGLAGGGAGLPALSSASTLTDFGGLAAAGAGATAVGAGGGAADLGLMALGFF